MDWLGTLPGVCTSMREDRFDMVAFQWLGDSQGGCRAMCPVGRRHGSSTGCPGTWRSQCDHKVMVGKKRALVT